MGGSSDRIHQHESENTPEVCSRTNGTARAQPEAIKEIDDTLMSKNLRIADMAMLGSHDAGTYNIKNLKGISVCQDLNLVDQAKAGVQYFDLRVRKKWIGSESGKWQFYHGERIKALGGFNASGDAEKELKTLSDYVKEHPERLFIFKLHFDEQTTQDSDINSFLKDNIVTTLRDNLIQMREGALLGQATMGETVHAGKNVAVLVHHAGKEYKEEPDIRNFVWGYGKNTYGGWGKTPKADELIAHLTKNIQKENEEGKILVSQTNLPAMIPPSLKVLKTREAWGGLKKLAESAHEKVAEGVANAMNGDYNPGVISGDFVGTEYASTDRYAKLRDQHNMEAIEERVKEIWASLREELSKLNPGL